jgi:maleylacetate reductase
MQPFVHVSVPARIVFARGARTRVAEEVQRLGIEHALVLSTPQQASEAQALGDQLGALAVGIFARATMHTPVDVTHEAIEMVRRLGADGVVAFGGGSTTGLGKAIAARTDLPQVVVPTTYAGSEVTPILGETTDGVKTTRSGPEILPETVIYDPDLTGTLPVALSVASGLNAMAHAAEAIYARNGSPLYTAVAVEALSALAGALPAIVSDAGDRDARDRALYGAWLCGTVLGAVGMSIHHKLCHALGGALDTPHAETHAVMLPHTLDFIEQAMPDALAPAAPVFGPRVGQGMYDFAQQLGAPRSLRQLGVDENDLDRVTEVATSSPYWSPRPIEPADIRQLLQHAWVGTRPGTTSASIR